VWLRAFATCRSSSCASSSLFYIQRPQQQVKQHTSKFFDVRERIRTRRLKICTSQPKQSMYLQSYFYKHILRSIKKCRAKRVALLSSGKCTRMKIIRKQTMVTLLLGRPINFLLLFNKIAHLLNLRFQRWTFINLNDVPSILFNEDLIRLSLNKPFILCMRKHNFVLKLCAFIFTFWY